MRPDKLYEPLLLEVEGQLLMDLEDLWREQALLQNAKGHGLHSCWMHTGLTNWQHMNLVNDSTQSRSSAGTPQG